MQRQLITKNVDPITNDDLSDLARSVGPVVSLFAPTHRAGPETHNDAAQLRPLLEQAEAQLADQFPDVDAATLLEPIRSLGRQERFWQEQVDGLAVFAGPGFSRYFRTTNSFTPHASVGEHPDLRPLLPAIADDTEFIVLAVSRNRVRLLRGDRTSITELPLGEIPASIDDVEGYSTREPQFQHQGSPSGTAPAHGHGAREDNVLAGFLQVVGKGTNNRFSKGRVPLVIASVSEYYGPLSAELSNVHLLGKPVAGNPDNLSPAQLHEAAWPLVEQNAAARHERNKDQFAQALGTGLASGDPASILAAAESGRVETMLLTERGLHQPDNADNLNRALALTLQTSGSVDVVDELASGYKSGAVYRY